jgi:hypothetical protein
VELAEDHGEVEAVAVDDHVFGLRVDLEVDLLEGLRGGRGTSLRMFQL